MARLPQAAALFAARRPLEILAAEGAGDFLHGLCLFADRSGAAVELEEERRQFLQRRMAVAIDGRQGQRIEQLDARHGNAELDRLDHGLDRRIDVGEHADRRGHRFRDRVELDRQFGDDAERAFRSDQQACEVVAGRGLARPATGLDDATVSQDDGHAEDVVAHRSVTHGVGSRGTRCRHAAERGIGTGVDREEQAAPLERGVELQAGNPGLDRRVEIVGVHGDDPVHPGETDGQAAVNRQNLSFDRTARAVGNHRHAMTMAEGGHVGNFLRALGEQDAIRQGRLMNRLVAPVLEADRVALRKARAGSLTEQRCDFSG